MLKGAGCFKILLFCMVFVTATATIKADPAVKLIQISKGLLKPLYVTNAGDDSNRLFVVEKGGKIKIIKDNVIQKIPFLDIESRVDLRGNETGLLSMAFHPDYKNK